MSKIIEEYRNKLSGEIVLTIIDTGKSYRYIGKGTYGAGCCKDLEEMKKHIFAAQSPRKLARIELV